MNTFWNELLPHVEEYSATLPDRDSIRAGYAHLRECLGEDAFRSHRQALSGNISNLVPDSLAKWSALGHLLAFIRDQYGTGVLNRLRARVLDEDENTVWGALAELEVFERLRARGVLVRLVRATGKRRSADIVVDSKPPTDLEVSFLSTGSTWKLARELVERLKRGVAPLALEHGFFIRVECSGFAGDLLRHVPDAVERFRTQLGEARPWSQALAPGMTFHVEDSSAGIIVVRGATIRSADLNSEEGVLTRLPDKMREEAKQVRQGGIVLIRSSELSSVLLQSKDASDEVMRVLVARIADVGSLARNVSVFAVLDEVGSTEEGFTPFVSTSASFTQAMNGLTRQRLLWMTNPHAITMARPEMREWFALPF